MKHQYGSALADYNETIRLRPDDPVAHNNRGNLYSALGDLVAANDDYRQAAAIYRKRIANGSAAPLIDSHFAWMLATCPISRWRDGRDAIRYSTRACELTFWKNPEYIDDLATAYAEVGNFTVAAALERKALAATDGAEPDMMKRLALFQKHQPYRD